MRRKETGREDGGGGGIQDRWGYKRWGGGGIEDGGGGGIKDRWGYKRWGGGGIKDRWGYRRCKGNNGGTGLATQYRTVEHVYVHVHSHPLVPTGYIPKGLQTLPRHGAPQFHFGIVIGTGDEESPELSSGGGERGEEREGRRERGGERGEEREGLSE